MQYLIKMPTDGVDLALDISRGIVVFLIFLAVSLALRRVIKAAIGRMSTQGHVDHIVAQLVYATILIVGIVVALSATGRVNVAALVTSLGLAGVAVGFAVKDVLSNFLAGLFILVQRPFTIGDEIALSGVEGRVESVRVRDTLVKTSEGTLVYVPNNIVFNSVVVNKSAFDRRLVTCRVTVHRQAAVDDVFKVCSRILSEAPEVLRDPGQQLLLEELGEDGATFKLKFWIDRRISSPEAVKSTILQKIDQDLPAQALRFLKTTEEKIEESP